ncbi:hypothetical protein J2857_005171 [Neorhizobium galegae]|nr:hypothetical protein [Neorhizobium galegae]
MTICSLRFVAITCSKEARVRIRRIVKDVISVRANREVASGR